MKNHKEQFDANNDNLTPSKDNIRSLNSSIFSYIKDIFGSAVAEHLRTYIQKYNIDFADPEQDPIRVREVIYDIFGEHGSILEKEIVRMISITKGLEFDPNDDLELLYIRLKIEQGCNVHKTYINEELCDRSKYCKICNKTVYGVSSLASLCNECYRLQEELVTNILNELV